jgi:hypothetical protein
LLQSYTSASITFSDGDWLQWSGLSIPLATNVSYAWSFGRTSSGTGYEALAVATNKYAGGEIGLFPTAGGAVTFGGSHSFDAVFDLGIATSSSQLLAGAPVVLPERTNYIGMPDLLVAAAAGTPPLSFQWQTDGGGGGSLTNIPNATNVSLTVTPPGTGAFKFGFIVTNAASGSASSSVAVATVISPVTVTANVSQHMATMPSQGLGVCTAIYDNILINYPSIATQLKAAGISAIRFPGGSVSDVYNWQNNSGIDGQYVNSNDSFDNVMNDIVNPAGAQAIVTVNYGSNPANNAGGDTNVAAAWVAHANVTNNWGVKYWEIGNEVGGNGYYAGQDWEYDLHFLDQTAADRVGQPALSPAAYGTNSIQFISAMKAKDPTIKCGVGFNTGLTSYNTSLLNVCGSVVDFVIIHYYPGGDAAGLLAASSTISNTVKQTCIQLTNTVGATHAGQMQIAVTETGAGSVTGVPVSLFAADNYLTWIENGAVNVDYQILHNDILTSSQTPGHAYYGAMMAHLLANVGDTFLKTTSSQPLLRVHATTRQDGRTGILLVSTDPIRTTPVNITISGATLAAWGTCYQFGLTNFIGANDYPSYPVSTNPVTGLGSAFTINVPPYTMIDLLLSPGATTSVGLATSANPSTYGNSLTFTATVQTNNVAVGGISGETIAFFNGAVQLGTGTLNGSGQATYATSATQLPASTCSITAGYGGDSAYIGSTNSPALSQIVNPAPLTAGLTGTVNKNYDGTTAAKLAAGNYTLAGVAGGDTVTLNNPTSGTYDTRNQGGGKTVNVTGLVISGASATNYTLSSSSASGAVGAINKTNITVTAAANTKPYDGTISAAALPTVTSGGVQTGDTANFVETYATRNVGGGETLTPSGAVTDGNSGNNYNYSFVASANGAISAVTLTYAANTASMTYGSAVPGLSGSVGGFVTGDNQANATTGTLNFTTTATSSSSVGSYAINGSGLTANNGNYTFAQAAGNATALTINTLAANLTGSRPYDKTTTAAAGILSVTNKVGGDNVTVASGSGSLAGANVGSQAITSFGTLALGGTAAGNYTLSGASGSVNITAAGLAVTNLPALDKVYDGTTNATLDATNAGLAGVLNGDSVTLVTSNAVGYFAGPNAGTNKPVTVSGLALGGTEATNYVVAAPTNLAANIWPAPVTIESGITANNKAYDGTEAATISSNNVVLDGVISGDVDYISLSTNAYTATFATADAGSNIVVTVSGLSLTGSAMANYTLNQPTGLTADILSSLIPALTGISMESEGWQLSFSGPAGQSYHVLATDDLMLPLNQWTVLAGGTFGSGTVTFTDSSTNLSQRFYRIVSP